MVNLYVVASDRAIIPVLEACSHNSEIRLAGVWLSEGSLLEAVLERFPQFNYLNHWEDVFDQLDESTALLVAGTSDDVVLAAKQFSAVSRATLFVVTEQHAAISELFRYMSVWQDAQQQIIPLFTSGVTGAINDARSRISGPLQRIDFQRVLRQSDTSNVFQETITLDEMDHALLQDLEWISQFGHYTHVTTLLTSQREETAVEATVTLKGDDAPEVRWNLTSNVSGPRWKMLVYGAEQSFSLTCEGALAPVLTQGDVTENLPYQPALHVDIVAAILKGMMTETEQSSWMDVVCNGEIGAAARRSIQRKRTIPIHFEEASERSQFKSQMTAIGCGVLLWIMFGIIAVLTLASIIDPRDREYRHSSAAGFVLTQADFVLESPQLNTDGQALLGKIADVWSETTPVLLIEATNSDLDQQRETEVERLLLDNKLRNVESKCVVRPLTGKWFEKVLLLAWGIVFLPLILVLIAQGLLIVARPSEQ